MRNSIGAAIIAASLLVAAGPAHAATKTWANTGTDYNTAANWVGGILPGSSDTATFSNAVNTSFQPNISAAITNNSITFAGTDASGYVLSSSGPALWLSGNLAISSEHTSGTNTISANLVLNRAAAGISIIRLSTNGSMVISGDISEANPGITLSLGRNTTGTTNWTFMLSGTNTHSGGTDVSTSGGRLNINGAWALGTGPLKFTAGTGQIFDNISGSPMTLSNNNAMLLSSASPTFAGSSDLSFGTGGIILSNGNRTVTVNANTLTFGGVTDDGTNRVLKKDGAGTLAINGAGTHGGGTTLSAGTLVIGHNSALGTGKFIFDGGVVLAGGGARTIANDVDLTAAPVVGGTNDLTINGAFTQSGGTRSLIVSNTANTTLAGNVYLSETNTTGRTMTIAGTGNVIINGVIADYNGAGTAGGFTLNNSATLTLNNSNTFSGVAALSAGSLVLGNKGAFGQGFPRWNGVTVSASTDLTGANAIPNISTNGGNNGFTGTNSLEFSGPWTSSGSRFLTNSISGGTLTFSGPMHLSTTATNADNLRLTMSGSGNTVISGDVDNGLGSSLGSFLDMNGPGTLTLSGNNTYGGSTTLRGGTLYVNGSGATSLTTVASGSTLGGTGVLNGPVTTVNGAIAPGSSVGTLTISNRLALTTNTVLNFELGASSDLLAVSGDLVLNGTLNVTNSGGLANGVYPLITYGGTLTDSTLDVNPLPGSFTGTISNDVDSSPKRIVLVVSGGGGTPPTADFSGAPTNGVEPMSVAFTDASTGSPTSWAWDFENNGSTDSTGQNPTNIYAAGTYTVKLVACNGDGCSTNIKTAYIDVITVRKSWENRYGVIADGGDFDVDGMLNTNEFLAGFSPTNGSARLQVTAVTRSGSDVTITFLGANGDSTYAGGPSAGTNVLEVATNLLNGGFVGAGQTNVLSGGTGLGASSAFVETNGAALSSPRFYRVRVLTP